MSLLIAGRFKFRVQWVVLSLNFLEPLTMAGHSHDHHHSHNPLIGGIDPQFGKATPGKLGMWIFLVTDAMSFSGFLIAYAVLRSKLEWPNPSEYLGITLSGI